MITLIATGYLFGVIFFGWFFSYAWQKLKPDEYRSADETKYFVIGLAATFWPVVVLGQMMCTIPMIGVSIAERFGPKK